MIPVAIAFTPNYFVPAATMLHSLFRNADMEQQYTVYCLESEEIPQRQKDMLGLLTCGRNVTYSFLHVNSLPPGTAISSRYSEAALYRLMLPELLPDLDRILYLDSDIIIRRDIARVFSETDVTDMLLAAVAEPPIEDQEPKRKAMGLDPRQYFNSGFLILNLDLMRREASSTAMLDLLKDDSLEFPDQDALNQVCKGRVRFIHPSNNSIRTFFIDKYRPAFLGMYSASDLDEVITGGNIHYTGGKPWNMHTVQFGAWWDEYRMLPDSIRQEWTPRHSIIALARFCSTDFGRKAVELARKAKSIFAK